MLSKRSLVFLLLSVILFASLIVWTVKKKQMGNINVLEEKIENNSSCLDQLTSINSTEEFYGDIATVNFMSNEQARVFKTAIEKSVAKGSNFAGHYNITTWGCGTDCFGYAVVDVQNGEIIEYAPVHENYKYRPSERMTNLFIIDPVNAGDERSFYSIVDGEFKQVCSEISDQDLYQLPN